MPVRVTKEWADRIRRLKQEFPSDLTTEEILVALDAGRAERAQRLEHLLEAQPVKKGR